MPFGAEVRFDGVRFRLWAPNARSVSLCLEGPEFESDVEPDRKQGGWYEAIVAEARVGTRYRYRIDGSMLVPDPVSRYQPDDVHAASEVVDPTAYAWSDVAWKGRPWEEVVLYELHVGTFSPAGTYAGAIERLDDLVELGVTAIELMPVADFPGRWNWGYDGVSLFAPDSSYGRPEDLKALVDAAHRKGLMVFLDVVYNHFGPEGNYLHAFAKQFFNEDRHTPWGAAINFDGPGSEVVRAFYIENALYWLEEFHFDGLRFDAVHAIEDDSDPDILNELATRVHQYFPAERHIHLVLENDDNVARYLDRADDGSVPAYVAQWNDDIHHCFHVLLTGEDEGYYVDYATDPAALLARCLTEGFAYQGDPSRHRGGEARGEPSSHLPATAFVSFFQNHDQIGNRAFGDRISALASVPAVRAAAAVMLLAPSPPLIFMGEEWAATSPFLFFCDFGPDLREAVREGRRKEFSTFSKFKDPAIRERIPDPCDPDTVELSRLRWNEREIAAHAEMLAHYRRLLALRKRYVVPRLAGIRGHGGDVVWCGGSALMVRWRLAGDAHLTLIGNLGAERARGPQSRPEGAPIYATHPPADESATGYLQPWSVAWYLEAQEAESE